MRIPTEEKKKEAVDRMRALNMYEEIIAQFDCDGLVNESVPPAGACYWIDGPVKEHVKEFEASNNALVYHVIHGKYILGGCDVMEMEAFLYVGDYAEEWEQDRDDIEGGQVFAYIYNDTEPAFSEFGPIGVELSPAGGLRRSW